jgi:hypothetical protein
VICNTQHEEQDPIQCKDGFLGGNLEAVKITSFFEYRTMNVLTSKGRKGGRN